MATYHVTVGDREYEISFGSDGSIAVNGNAVACDIVGLGGASYSVLVGSDSFRMVAEPNGSGCRMLLRSQQYDIRVESERQRMLRQYDAKAGAASQRTEIHAPMPALIVKIEVAVGDEVREGQGLLVLEAMKMENEIKSHRGGRVKSIHVAQRKAVEKGELLMVIE
jgi:biotin carboxyl carrier protein